jgi:hypothetical protein
MSRTDGQRWPPDVSVAVGSARVARYYVLAVLLLSGTAPCLGSQAYGQDVPVSIERIRAGVEKPRALEIDATSLQPLATFRTTVEQPQLLLTLEEQLRKEFRPTAFQRQSWEWASKCCGVGLGAVLGSIRQALEDERERRIRERIAREIETLPTAVDRR